MMGQYAVMFHERSGVRIWLNYRDTNLALQSAQWRNPSRFPARLRVWNNEVLAYDGLLPAESEGSESIPGNHRLMTEIDAELGTILRLPAGVTYRMNWPAR